MRAGAETGGVILEGMRGNPRIVGREANVRSFWFCLAAEVFTCHADDLRCGFLPLVYLYFSFIYLNLFL